MTSSKLLLYKRLLSTLLSQIVIIMIFSWVKTNPYHRHLHQKKVLSLHFFFYQGFFHGHWQLTGQRGKGGDHLLFYSTTSTRSRTFRHLFATFHVRWLSHIFNRNACIYQTATRWDLPPYRITIWLIDDVILIFVCLLVDLILGLVTAIWHEKPVDSNSHQLSSLMYLIFFFSFFLM